MNIDELDEALKRTSVSWFSNNVLGMQYSQLKKVVYPKPQYKTFIIKKRNGNPRVIEEPRQELKLIQQNILAYLSERAGPIKPALHGFVRKRSIVSNSKNNSEG